VNTVLIVATDLGFALWLGQALDQAGYNALPAVSATGAMAVVAHLGVKVDLVVIEATMTDADCLLSFLRRDRPRLTVIALLDESKDGRIAIPKADLAEYKPAYINDDARRDWLSTVHTVFEAKSVRYPPATLQ